MPHLLSFLPFSFLPPLSLSLSKYFDRLMLSQRVWLIHTNTLALTQPEVVCNRGFQGGQQDRQFNLKEKEGW